MRFSTFAASSSAMPRTWMALPERVIPFAFPALNSVMSAALICSLT
jgi:hypothetical protein